MVMVHAPTVGLESMTNIIELASAGTLTNLGFDKAYLPYTPPPVPSTNTLKKFLFELRVDDILLTGKEIKNKELALLYDKGEYKT